MAATRSRRCDTGRANHLPLTWSWSADSVPDMRISLRLTRRRAVDLLRVAAALCS
ncbi:putative leader peptide [Streptomyces sp. NPDC059468]|uniref:putative leader peptide n=1 Tax=unclassified Streptomyces TaxID=2593676 RepID=UPI003696160A